MYKVKVDNMPNDPNSYIHILDELDHVNGKVREIHQLSERLVGMYSRKNRDYGDSFDKSLDEDGLLVAKIRLSDKLNRFSQLIKQEGVVLDESKIDTLLDLANYAIMTVRWIEDEVAKDDSDGY